MEIYRIFWSQSILLVLCVGVMLQASEDGPEIEVKGCLSTISKNLIHKDGKIPPYANRIAAQRAIEKARIELNLSANSYIGRSNAFDEPTRKKYHQNLDDAEGMIAILNFTHKTAPEEREKRDLRKGNELIEQCFVEDALKLTQYEQMGVFERNPIVKKWIEQSDFRYLRKSDADNDYLDNSFNELHTKYPKAWDQIKELNPRFRWYEYNKRNEQDPKFKKLKSKSIFGFRGFYRWISSLWPFNKK